VTYTPNQDFNGTDTFNYTASDGSGGTDTATVTVTVTIVGGGGDFTLSVYAYKVKGDKYADLTWNGANSTNVDVYRDGSWIVTTANDDSYTHGPFSKGKPATYQVCEAETSTCSNEVTVSWP
jgi:hypothetical protein